MATTKDKSIYSQLLDFQKEIRVVSKDSKGYGYTYASFDNIVETIKPALENNGLGFTHTFAGSQIICTVFNDKGDTITSTLDLVQDTAGKMSASQQQGSAITYARRYTLSAILGLVTEEDTDRATKTPPRQQNVPQRQNIKPKKVVNAGDNTYLTITNAFDKFSDWENLQKNILAKYSVDNDVLTQLKQEFDISKSGLVE